jgi:hypothetical protein
MPPVEKMWYTLQHGIPNLRVVNRGRDDGPPEQPCYMEYIVTDKPTDQINWESTDET